MTHALAAGSSCWSGEVSGRAAVVCAGTGPAGSVKRELASMAFIAPSRASWTNSPGRVLHAEGEGSPAGCRRRTPLGSPTPRPNRASQNSSLLAREWEQLTHHYQIEYGPRRERARNGDGSAPVDARPGAGTRADALDGRPLPALRQLLDWIDAFPESAHGSGLADGLRGRLPRASSACCSARADQTAAAALTTGHQSGPILQTVLHRRTVRAVPPPPRIDGRQRHLRFRPASSPSLSVTGPGARDHETEQFRGSCAPRTKCARFRGAIWIISISKHQSRQTRPRRTHLFCTI